MSSSSDSCVASSLVHAAQTAERTSLCSYDALIALTGDAKYTRVEELRRLMRRDPRFVWTALPSETGDVHTGQILIRQKGLKLELGGGDDAQLRALLESDSIPQYVWPAASPLQQWIMAHSDLFAEKTVLELGCGTGIIGFTVARYAKLVVLSDCSAVSLAMAAESLRRNKFHNCRVAALSWGREDQLAHIKDVCHLNAFDVVIGSDVFYFSSALKSGLATARGALGAAASSDALFVCGSVARSERMECDLDEMPGQHGFELSAFVADEPFHLYCWRVAAA